MGALASSRFFHDTTAMPHLIFLCGHAGTGKTTLARRLVRELNDRSADSYCMLDKDTLYGNFSSAVMGVLTGNPNDRDSPVYLDNLRNPEYAGLLDTARDNLQLGTHVLVVAPLSRGIRAHQLIDRDWLRVGPEVQVTVVWVHLQEAEARRLENLPAVEGIDDAPKPTADPAAARPAVAGQGEAAQDHLIADLDVTCQ